MRRFAMEMAEGIIVIGIYSSLAELFDTHLDVYGAVELIAFGALVWLLAVLFGMED